MQYVKSEGMNGIHHNVTQKSQFYKITHEVHQNACRFLCILFLLSLNCVIILPGSAVVIPSRLRVYYEAYAHQHRTKALERCMLFLSSLR